MGGLVDAIFGGGDSPPPPDYTPMANASKEAAEISAKLGREQLDESRRQYDRTMELSAPILASQKKTMDLAYEQGKTNFDNFLNEGRPLQQRMRDIAMGNITPDVQRQMDTAATENVADVSAQLDNQRQQTNRNMMRMGVMPGSGKFAALSGQMDVGAATAKASAANVGRTSALDKVYARSGDVLNTYSGIASQAPAFYSAGTNAGNSAVGNSNAIGSTLTSGMAQGAGTTMGGQQVAMQGLGGILNSQSTLYGQAQQSKAEMMGAIIGAGGRVAASDRRLKENIELVGKDAGTGLNLYEFSYINDTGTRYVGVMADEVALRFPAAVAYDDSGFASVDYGMLGIEFKEVA